MSTRATAVILTHLLPSRNLCRACVRKGIAGRGDVGMGIVGRGSVERGMQGGGMQGKRFLSHHVHGVACTAQRPL